MGRSSKNSSICVEYNFAQFPWEKTPKEMFSKEKLEVSDLNIFGFHVYIHIPNDKRSKLDPSGKKGLFI